MASRGVGGGGVCKHVSLTTVKLAAKYIQKLKRGQHWIDIYKFVYDDSKKMQNQISHVFQMLDRNWAYINYPCVPCVKGH